jgi:hypothetical protein
MVIPQSSLPFMKQPGRTEGEGVILYDGLLPEDLKPWTRRGYYDLIALRPSPSPLKSQAERDDEGEPKVCPTGDPESSGTHRAPLRNRGCSGRL